MTPQVSQDITRRSASNLALAFILLPRERRNAMATLYAFCREVDDVADEDAVPVAERRQRLTAWREDVHAACSGGTPRFPVNRELQPVIQRHRLPFAYFDEILRGCEADLETVRYPDYPRLEAYCYQVASAVGLLSIEIFGYQDQGCRTYATALGKALQFTNILRDVRNDAERGRIYLPQSELARFGVSEESILGHGDSPAHRALAASFAERARAFYHEARTALPPADRQSMVAAELMAAVYWRLLEKIQRRNFAVFGPRRVRLGQPHKLALIVRAWWRLRTGTTRPSYG